MTNEREINEQTQENAVVEEDRLTVEVPTEIQAGRSSDDCYYCYVLA